MQLYISSIVTHLVPHIYLPETVSTAICFPARIRISVASSAILFGTDKSSFSNGGSIETALKKLLSFLKFIILCFNYLLKCMLIRTRIEQKNTFTIEQKCAKIK